MAASARTSPLLPIFLIVVVDVLGLTIILPLLPFYAEKFGASPLVVGLLTSSYAVCQLVSGPLLGALSDRTGRKPLLLVSQVGTFIGFLILARAEVLWVVFVARVIDGSTAGNLSLAQAYISDVTLPKDRAKSFAVIGIAFGIGFLIGPALSGYLAQFGLATPVYAAAGLSATSILATLFLLPANPTLPEGAAAADEGVAPSAPGGQRLSLLNWGAYAAYFRRPVLSGMLAQFFIYCFAFSMFTSGFSLFAERRFTWNGHPFTVREVGYVFAFSGLLGIVLQGKLIGVLVKRFGEAKLIRAGFVSQAAGYLLLGITYQVAPLLGVAALTSFGQGALRPTLTALISRSVSRSEQGVVLGLNQSLNSIAQILAPPLAGLFIDHLQLRTWAWTAALASLVGFIAIRWGSGLFADPALPSAEGATRTAS